MATGRNDELVKLLGDCIPGNLAPDVFESVARVSVSSAVEFIPLRKRHGEIEVLLLDRPVDDPIWPSMLHTPGTILRPTDQTFQDAFKRLCIDELGNIEIEEPIFMGAEMSANERGRCVLLEYLIIVKGEPVVGDFYNVKYLPDRFIESQIPSLFRAVKVFVG